MWLALRQPAPTPPVPAATRPPRGSTPPPPPSAAPLLAPSLATPPPLATPPAFAPEDEARMRSLEALARGAGAGAASDVDDAEALLARYPGQPYLTSLAASTLMRVGVNDARQRRFPEAAARFRRAAQLLPGDVTPRLSLANLLIETGDWPAAEAAAREVLRLDPRRSEAHEALAFALYRQDRNAEAIEVLQAALALGESASARTLLARVEKGLRDEQGMTEQRIAHFHVRYDGEAHDDVGREILRALERHFATLVVSLDHQPASTLPVVLFSRQQYYASSGAPAWAGGHYDHIDGRIRIPIGGLTASLTPDMDDTLIHELTHAFVADMSAGLAPREIHEGLAQYMEGHRTGAVSEPTLRAMADGRLNDVGGYYLQALSLTEYLIAQRGLRGVIALLKAMGRAGQVDAGCRSAYGKDWAELQHDWRARLRQQHGS
jgi:hypothetical protein